MKPQNELPFLKDTTLCAIVRDEEINPAGGVADWLHCTLPFVEQAVIADTGSKDKTRQILEEMQGQYKNLKVFEHEFDGFAESRNSVFTYIAKNNLGTKYSLFLDADERIPRLGFENIWKWMTLCRADGYSIPIYNVDSEFSNSGGHNPRIVLNKKGNHFKNFSGLVYEWIYNQKGEEIYSSYPGIIDSLLSNITIYHFVPKEKNLGKEKWYKSLKEYNVKDPREFPGFIEGKKFNAIRLNKRFQKTLGLPGYKFSLPEVAIDSLYQKIILPNETTI